MNTCRLPFDSRRIAFGLSDDGIFVIIFGIVSFAWDLYHLIFNLRSRSRLFKFLSNSDQEVKALNECMDSKLKEGGTWSDEEDSLNKRTDSAFSRKQQAYFKHNNDCDESCERKILTT